MTASPPPTYWDYLDLQKLLACQGGLEGDEDRLEPDELHFIIVHQAFELWFKLVLRELRLARDNLAEENVPEERVPYVVRHLGRVNAIFTLLVDQFRVVETLTPQDFLSFRDKIVPASGFQSFQMREIEILLGLPEEQRKSAGLDPLEALRVSSKTSPGGAEAWGRIERARSELDLWTCLQRWLYRTPIRGSGPGDIGDGAAVDSFLQDYMAAYETLQGEQARDMARRLGVEPSSVKERFSSVHTETRRFLFAEDAPADERTRIRRIRAALLFIESYRDLPLLAWPRVLVDAVVELDQLLVLWRTRHARMVERTIGRRVGTGGSSGVDYLDKTARYRVFPELWAVRTVLLPRSATPPLRETSHYRFKTDTRDTGGNRK